MKTLQIVLFAMLLFCNSVLVISAQVSINGSLRGQIADPNGAAVPNASLSLVNRDTKTTLNTTTNDDGEYNFARVSSGIYTLSVTANGFQKAVRENVVVTVSENVGLDISLSVGEVSQTVEVTNEQRIVQAETSSISSLVSERRVAELPLNGKDFQKLILLAPGVGGRSFGNPSISGARLSANTYTVDGGSISDERVATGIASTGGIVPVDEGQFTPSVVPTESLKEFRIITSNADATFGRSSGGQINIISKNGTNSFRGSIYDYFRNDALDARNFFNTGPFFNSDGSAKVPPFKQNLFGASVGGPIYFLGFGEGTPILYKGKDKNFFFVNFETFRQRRQATATVTVPNADLLSFVPGDLGRLLRTYYITRGVVPASGNPAGSFAPLSSSERTAALAAGFPTAFFDGNTTNGEAGTSLVSLAPVSNIDQNNFFARTDHNLTENLTASFRFLYSSPTFESGGLTVLDRRDINQKLQSFTGQLIYNISPNQIMEIRPGILRTTNNSGTKGGLDPRILALGLPPVGYAVNLGAIGLGNISFFPSRSFIDNQTTPQFAAIHTWSKNNLTIRTGTDIRLIRIEVDNISGAQTTYDFSNFVGSTGILGSAPNQAQAIASAARFVQFGADGSSPISLRNWQSNQSEFFTQADYRLFRNLTVNGGLRYSYFSPNKERDGLAGNLYAVNSSGQFVPDVSPFEFGRTANNFASVTDDRPLYQPDKNNFQPRIGFAWDIFGTGKTVVRGAYGFYIDRIYQLVFSNNISNLPQAVSSNTSFVPFVLGSSVPVVAQTPQYTGVDPTLRNPETHRFSFGVEQELTKDMSVSAFYVGLRGRKLIRAYEPNGSGSVPQNLRPDTRFSDQRIYANLSESEYDSLQISFRRRLSKGLDLTLAYTYAKSEDDFSVDRTFGRAPTLLNLGASAAPGFQGGGSQFVNLPLNADFGPSDFDVRHNLTISHVYDLPFGRGRTFLSNAKGITQAIFGGWSLNGIFIFRTGEPFTVIRGIDYNDDGSSGNDRPQLISGSLSSLYANGSAGRTQYLVPLATALTFLNTPTNVIDPFLPIKRNSFTSPRVSFYDVSLVKKIKFNERLGLQLEANAFNVTNTPQFAAPNANLTSSFFGRITSTRAGTTPRQLQFGAKLTF